MGCLAKFYFYSSLAYNVVLQKFLRFPWYDRIDDVVILGALPFRNMTRELLDEGVKGVVSLTEPHETKYWVNTSEEWRSYGIEQLIISTPDWNSVPSEENIKSGVDFILQHKGRSAPNSVYVHCKAGRSRSATVVACYLLEVLKCTPQEAVDFMSSHRARIRIRPRHLKAIELYHEKYITKPLSEKIKSAVNQN